MAHLKFSLIFLSLSFALGACGGGGNTQDAEPVEEDTSGQEEASDETVPSPAMAFDEMSHEDQQAWMQNEVTPRMGAMFREFDGERYAQVGCTTCHGPGALQGEFHMPSNALPALPATGTPEQQQMADQYTEMATFMFQRVLPTMQTLLGEQPYDEATQEGFSCYACHPHAGDEGSHLIELRLAQ